MDFLWLALREESSVARFALFLGAVFSFLSVAFGAFGAHALKNKLPEYNLNVFHTAVQYQFWHALALLVIGVIYLRETLPYLNTITLLFTLGIFIFSGSLYLLALTDIRVFGAITPIGGLLFLSGWILFSVSAWKQCWK